jgi:hypothetical protein
VIFISNFEHYWIAFDKKQCSLKWLPTSITIKVCVNIRPKRSPSQVFVEITAEFLPWEKSNPNYELLFYKISTAKINNNPIGEHSPNLATLLPTETRTLLSQHHSTTLQWTKGTDLQTFLLFFDDHSTGQVRVRFRRWGRKPRPPPWSSSLRPWRRSGPSRWPAAWAGCPCPGPWSIRRGWCRWRAPSSRCRRTWSWRRFHV